MNFPRHSNLLRCTYIYIYIWRFWLQNVINAIKKKVKKKKRVSAKISIGSGRYWKVFFFILHKMRYVLCYSVMFSPFFSKPQQMPVSLLCRIHPLNQSQSTIPRTVNSTGNCFEYTRHPSFPHLLCTLWSTNKQKFELQDKSHVIVMRISSVKPVLWSPLCAFRYVL